MKHNGNIPLKILDEEGYAFFEPEHLLRVENYKKEKITRINRRAGNAQPSYFKLYTKDKLANMSAAEEFGIELESEIAHPIDVHYDFELRWYQPKPLNELLEKPYGLLWANVAFGKTHCLGWIIQQLQGKTVIMCNTQINAEQCANRLKDFFGEDKVGLYYSYLKEFKDITVIVYNSYGKFLEKYNGQFDILIQDECDLLTTDKYLEQTIKTKCQYKYGLTGTPYGERFKQEDFQLWRGRIIEAEEYNKALIDQFEFNIQAVQVGEKKEVYKDYNALKTMMENDYSIIEAIKEGIEYGLEKGCKILILTDRKEFSNKIGNALDLPVITGDLSKKKRKIMFEEFEDKKALVAIQNIVGRGYDDPEIDMIIIAFSGRAEARLVQSLGRGLRQQEGKDKIYVYDIVYNAGMMFAQWKVRKKCYEQYTDNVKYKIY